MARSVTRTGLIRPDPYRVSSAVEHREAISQHRRKGYVALMSICVNGHYLDFAGSNVAQRVIYAETAATGQGVTETRNTKAKAEIAELWNYLRRLI